MVGEVNLGQVSGSGSPKPANLLPGGIKVAGEVVDPESGNTMVVLNVPVKGSGQRTIYVQRDLLPSLDLTSMVIKKEGEGVRLEVTIGSTVAGEKVSKKVKLSTEQPFITLYDGGLGAEGVGTNVGLGKPVVMSGESRGAVAELKSNLRAKQEAAHATQGKPQGTEDEPFVPYNSK